MEDEEDTSGLGPVNPPWEIGLDPRRWTVDEFHARGEAFPEKMELIDGRLFWSQEERLALLAGLLEQVGLTEAVRLAPRELWLAALDRANP